MAATYSLDDRLVATITLAEPDRRNALSNAMVAELAAHLTQAGTDRARVVVLAAEGGVFCSGGDLSAMQVFVAGTRDDRLAASREFSELLVALDTIPAVTVARVEGPAFGGGVGLAAVCDVVAVGEHAAFTLTETSLGLTPANIAPYLVRRLGVTAARRMMVTARAVDADAARCLGLADIPVSDIDAEVERVLRCAPEAVAATKRLVALAVDPWWSDMREAAVVELADTWERPEVFEGIAAFVQKRSPSWAEGTG
jgi:methylglutaconyl-CoA hydratase